MKIFAVVCLRFELGLEILVTTDDVIWCYRHLLGREPESSKVIQETVRLRSFRAVVKQIVFSAEFQELVASEPSLTQDDVDWCYRNLLLRSPEGASVVADKMRHQNFRNLVADIAASEEFLTGRKLSDELDKLAFQLVNGRGPEAGEFLGGYSAIRILRVLRKRLDNGALMTDQPNLHAEIGSTKLELAETQHKLLIFQTCDHERYVPILQATSQTVLEYVRRWHCDYETFIGIKKGAHPWHASFNRIHKFGELMRSGFRGWVVYLDADYYFDIRRAVVEVVVGHDGAERLAAELAEFLFVHLLEDRALVPGRTLEFLQRLAQVVLRDVHHADLQRFIGLGVVDQVVQ
eukprot:gene20698-23509_t